MFGIDGGEIVVILLAILMLFGSDKVPEFARNFAKIMAKFKNASNDIKNEINKTIDVSEVTNKVNEEIYKVKNQFLNSEDNWTKDVNAEINKTKEDIDNITGPVKRL